MHEIVEYTRNAGVRGLGNVQSAVTRTAMVWSLVQAPLMSSMTESE